MSKTHKIKIESGYYERLADGSKKCEIRFNDRDYQAGDEIIFIIDDRVEPNTRCKITHVLHFPDGLKKGYVALSIEFI